MSPLGHTVNPEWKTFTSRVEDGFVKHSQAFVEVVAVIKKAHAQAVLDLPRDGVNGT